MNAPAAHHEDPRAVTNFELFFDLVFVFALTQVSSLIVHDLSFMGLLRGLLVLAPLWWAWGAYAWLTNAISTSAPGARAVVLAAMAAMLLVAIAVPRALTDDALLFSLAYFVVRALHVALYAVAGNASRQAILRLAPGNMLASCLLVMGAFLPPTAKLAAWVLAIAVDYGTPLLTGVGGFRVHAGHFVERHGLVIIIALGESIVAIGVGATVAAHDHALGALPAAACVIAMLVIAGLWWTYFDREAARTEHAMMRAKDAVRAHLARDAFSYVHFLLVAGVVLVAVGIKQTVAHVSDPLSPAAALALGGGGALYFLGLALVRFRRGDRPRNAHVLGAAFALALAFVAQSLPAVAHLALLGVDLFVVAWLDRNAVEPLAAVALGHAE
jgi:low temperature requirement protein LtrA